MGREFLNFYLAVWVHCDEKLLPCLWRHGNNLISVFKISSDQMFDSGAQKGYDADN